MGNKKKDNLFWGLLLLIIGGLFLMRNIGVDLNLWHLIGKFWPLLLIFIGVKNILVHTKNKK